MDKDYYKVLGIPKNASQDEIKRAYRDLAMKFHPDKNKSKDATEHFKEINEAYAVLGDPEKRQNYNLLGSEQFGQQYTPEDIFRNFNFESIFRDMGINAEFGFPGVSDLFGFSGAPQERGGRERGQDILHGIDLTLEEVAKGAEKEIRLKHIKECSNCKGSGAEPGSLLTKCQKCRGSGYITIVRSSMFARIQTVSACDECGGRGKTPGKTCKGCNGKGGVVAYDSIKVDIPHGVVDGMRLRLSGAGDYSSGGSGDLYLDMHVLKHKDFERDGDNIITNVTIPFYDAISGGEVTAPILGGSQKIAIDPGTQPGARIILDRKGIKGFRNNLPGDEIVNINIEIPKNLSDSEKELIKKFKEGRGSKKKFGLF